MGGQTEAVWGTDSCPREGGGGVHPLEAQAWGWGSAGGRGLGLGLGMGMRMGPIVWWGRGRGWGWGWGVSVTQWHMQSARSGLCARVTHGHNDNSPQFQRQRLWKGNFVAYKTEEALVLPPNLWMPQTAPNFMGNSNAHDKHEQHISHPPSRRNMRREERATVQGPVKTPQRDGLSHGGSKCPFFS